MDLHSFFDFILFMDTHFSLHILLACTCEKGLGARGHDNTHGKKASTDPDAQPWASPNILPLPLI